jgi:hypothetical protein
VLPLAALVAGAGIGGIFWLQDRMPFHGHYVLTHVKPESATEFIPYADHIHVELDVGYFSIVMRTTQPNGCTFRYTYKNITRDGGTLHYDRMVAEPMTQECTHRPFSGIAGDIFLRMESKNLIWKEADETGTDRYAPLY